MVDVDVGGVFTDFSVLNSETKRLSHYKHSSTPDDPSYSIVSGIHYILENERIDPVAVEYLVHGTTVATNTPIRKRGAHMSLITTRGSKDLMEIGNQKRSSLYGLLKEEPESLIPFGLKCEVEKRLLYDGSVGIPLNKEDVRKAVRSFQERNVTTIVVCMLFSFTNPAHERWIEETILEEYPEAYVSTSSKLVSELHEYSRIGTMVLNAYLGLVMKKYVENFRNSVQESGIAVAPYVIQSDGSIISIVETVERPIKTVMSGPSAGVVGATYTGCQCGTDKIVTFDMGGANADVSLIKNGKVQVSCERMVEGYPTCVSMINIITVGAGGGSIVTVDGGGALKVGPRSADVVPGPAYYMCDGKSPTVTGANILLGKLNRHKILGGHTDVDWNLAYDATQRRILGRSSLSVGDATVGIISVVNSNTVRAIHVASVEHGYGAHEFMLVTFGGAGPLHAREVARELGTTQVLLPPAPDTLCSLGFSMADTRFDLSQSYIMIVVPQDLPEMNRIFSRFTEGGDRILGNGDIVKEDHVLFYSLGCRYERQNHEVTAELPTGEITEEVFSGLVKQFHQKHERLYGYYDKKKDIQMIDYRAGAVGTTDKPDLSEYPVEENPQISALVEVRKIRFEGSPEYLDTNIYQRMRLSYGCTVSNPTITKQMDSTPIISSGWQMYNDLFLNLVITYHGGETA